MNHIFIIALTITLEAGNQGVKGMEAVASVIHNSATYPCDEAYVNECLKPKRYSCWNGRTPNMDMVYKYSQRSEWRDAVRLARRMVDSKFIPAIDATHYCRTDIVGKTSWTNSMDKICVVGDHSFFKETI